jgi:hypothetical protein
MESESHLNSIIKNKKLLLGTGALIISAVIGSSYYLYNILRNDIELTEDHKMQIEEIKEEIEESNGELTIESSILLVSLITKISHEIFNKYKSDINQRRRANIKNKEEYLKLCKETFRLKEKALNNSTKKVLHHFGNVSYEKIQKMIRKISPNELESITYNFNHPTFEENAPPDKNTVKDAFKFFANKFIEETEYFHKISKSRELLNNLEKYKNLYHIENSLIFDLLALKLKIDDELYLEFGYTEDQIRYLLYEYQLYEDPEVKKLYEAINSQMQF